MSPSYRTNYCFFFLFVSTKCSRIRNFLLHTHSILPHTHTIMITLVLVARARCILHVGLQRVRECRSLRVPVRTGNSAPRGSCTRTGMCTILSYRRGPERYPDNTEEAQYHCQNKPTHVNSSRTVIETERSIIGGRTYYYHIHNANGTFLGKIERQRFGHDAAKVVVARSRSYTVCQKSRRVKSLRGGGEIK